VAALGAGPSVSEVLRSLDSEVLEVVRPPRDEAVTVTDVVILDRSDVQCVHPGSVVLAVGLTGAEGEAQSLVDVAGRSGACAVVFRVERALPARLVEIADELDVTLLTVPLEMSWGQLFSLMRTATMSAGPHRAADASGIPVGDLFALADAIAATVGGPVTIEDPQWRLLAYSNLDYEIDEARRQTILGRLPPSVWQERLDRHGVTRALRAGQDVVRLDAAPFHEIAARLVAPVRAGGELLGSIWVAEGDVPLGPTAEADLRRVAEFAAVHLIMHRASDDVRRRARGTFVREALEGRLRSTSALALLPRSLGPLTALLFEPPDRGADSGAFSERILSVIGLYCEDFDADAVCAMVGDQYWALVPTPRENARDRTIALAGKVVSRVEQSLDVRLRVGIGSSVDVLADAPRSRRSAEQALKVLRGRSTTEPVVHIDDVQTHAILNELLEFAAEHSGFRHTGIAEMLGDAERADKHAETLRAYLDASGDVAAAARRLDVHPNTMRYRVRRILEMTPCNLDDPDERLVAELQLRLHERSRQRP